MVFRSVASVVLGGFLATLVVVAPAAADASVGALACSAPSGANRDVTLDLAIGGLAEEGTLPAHVEIAFVGAATVTDDVQAGTNLHYVAVDAIPAAFYNQVISVSVNVGDVERTCTIHWNAFTVTSFAVPSSVPGGQQVALSAYVESSFDLADFVAVLQYQAANGAWKKLASSAIDDGNARFSVSSQRWHMVRVAICYDQTCTQQVFASPAVVFNSVVATPTITSKPAEVIEGRDVSVSVLYGGYTTGASVKLQYRTASGAWSTLATKPLVHATATVSFAPSSTHTYRVAVTPSGGSTWHSSSFAVKFKPRLKITAASSVKKNSTVTFTLTQYLAPPFYAYLQKWSGSKWVTAKKFVVGNTVEKVSAKVSASSTWRVTAANYTSAKIKVKAT